MDTADEKATLAAAIVETAVRRVRGQVTICTWQRQCLFGAVGQGGMVLSDAGRFVETTLLKLHMPDDGVEIDTHVVMPDHLHAVIHLGTNPMVESSTSTPDLVGGFKLRDMKSWPGGVRRRQWPSYDTHLWQQSYYDTLIRNSAHLETTRRYILGNPGRWIERNLT